MAQVMDSRAAATTAKARGPFTSLHAFMKENSQVRGRMCQGRQAQAPAQPAAKPSEEAQPKPATTELESQPGKGKSLKRSLSTIGEFLFSGPEPYPLIMHRKGDSKKGLPDIKAYLNSGPSPYPVIL